MGVLANLSIIVVVLSNRLLLLQPTNLFLVNMCLSDLLNVLINPWLYFFRQGFVFRFYLLGAELCKLTPFLLGNLSTMISCSRWLAFFTNLLSDNNAVERVQPDGDQHQPVRGHQPPQLRPRPPQQGRQVQPMISLGDSA